MCDKDASKATQLEALKAGHETRNRKIEVLPGDFNETVYKILGAGTIGEKTATVVALSKHKRQTKIELFYFFATGWIDRSLGAVRADRTIAKVERWWARTDWSSLRGMDGIVRAKRVAKRFEDELGYGKANVYPIHSDRRGGRVMYHMIHATDHPGASPLMIRAYRKVSGRTEVEAAKQVDFEELWRRIEADED